MEPLELARAGDGDQEAAVGSERGREHLGEATGRIGARIALLPAAAWLIALLVNEPFGRMVLVLAVTVGIVLAGGLVGWIWGPKADPAAGWRPLSLIAGVAFSGVAAVALVISAAMVLQDLVHARFSVEALQAAPFVLVAGWYALLVTPFIPAFLVALPLAWLWYRLMVRAKAPGVHGRTRPEGRGPRRPATHLP